jgi:hypothetical protein
MAADRTSLGLLGLIFGGVTAFVMLTAVTVVAQHVEGRLALDPPAAITIANR